MPPRDRQSSPPFEYICPELAYRNFKTSLDYLFILFSSSNFLHSGSTFDHMINALARDNLDLSVRHPLFYV